MKKAILLRTLLCVCALICITPLYGMFSISNIFDKKKDAEDQKNPWEKLLTTLEQETDELDKAPSLSNAKAAFFQKEFQTNQRYTGYKSTDQIIRKIQSTLKQGIHTIEEIDTVRQQLKNTLLDHAKKLKEFLEDPTFTSIKKENKAAPTYDDLVEKYNQISRLEAAISEKEKQKTAANKDLTQKKSSLNAITDEIKNKKEERDNLGSTSDRQRVIGGELIDKQLELLEYRRDLEELRIKEIIAKQRFFETEALLLKKQLEIIKNQYDQIKNTIFVSSEYVQNSERAFEKTRQELLDEQTRINEYIANEFTSKKNALQNQITTLAQTYDLSASDLTAFKTWNKDLQTVRDWEIAANLGLAYTEDLLFETQTNLELANREIVKSKLQQKELELDIIKSWNLISRIKNNTLTKETITKEIKKYDAPKAELMTQFTTLKDQRDSTINQLHNLSLTLEKIKNLSEGLAKNSEHTFTGSTFKKAEIFQTLSSIKDILRKKLDLTAQLIEIYSSNIVIIETTLKQVQGIMSELAAENFWKRSGQSIEWKQIKNIFPDIKNFAYLIKMRFAQALDPESLRTFFVETYHKHARVQDLFFVLFLLIMCILLFLISKKLLPVLIKSLIKIRATYQSQHPISSTILGFIVAMLEFISRYYTLFFAWFSFFILVQNRTISGQFTSVLFYLSSIPLSILFLHGFFKALERINREKGFALIPVSLISRFFIGVQAFCDATVVIYFFREAFMIYNKIGSQLPTILLAFNFILLQITLLSLIGKEQLLALIPDSSNMGKKLEDAIDKFYYPVLFLLIAVIIMSNPYVGYGKQVFYIVSRILMSLLLVPVFVFIHNSIKKITASIFFYSTDASDQNKERFESSKTWYSFFVVLTFILFFVATMLIILWVWNKNISFKEIYSWFSYELYPAGRDEVTQLPISITAFSLFKIIAYLIGGFVLAYIVNNFILKRIFDPLIVGQGVQNTISTLTRYALIISAFLIGFNSVGLGSLATKIGIFVLAIGVVIKEPLGDIFSYFFILVQRPIKIGDLIMVNNKDDQVIGVVRQITARSTIIRNRNSTMYVIPNSQITNNIIANWSYVKSFVALDDILVTISYTADPQLVRQLIQKTLEENPTILKNPAPIIWLNDFLDNGFQFLVRPYIPSEKALLMWEIASNIRLELIKRLRENNVQLACPIRHIKVSKDTENIEIYDNQKC
ncbi:MAG: Conserved hypothetical transmembrane protein [candidate division TM6 bacterium GW2011_GWE2_41_16]|nr:MAG: Conserved hypothetical transmembrane protein [candidate division TM6 bacterium GW2011_GWE2_41_16]